MKTEQVELADLSARKSEVDGLLHKAASQLSTLKTDFDLAQNLFDNNLCHADTGHADLKAKEQALLNAIAEKLILQNQASEINAAIAQTTGRMEAERSATIAGLIRHITEALQEDKKLRFQICLLHALLASESSGPTNWIDSIALAFKEPDKLELDAAFYYIDKRLST